MKVIADKIAQYYELGGPAAEASAKTGKTAAKADTARADAAKTDAVESQPPQISARKAADMRRAIEKKVKSELGVAIKLRNESADSALQMLFAGVRDRGIAFGSNPETWSPETVAHAIALGHFDATFVPQTLAGGYLRLVSQGHIDDALKFEGRFAGQFSVERDDVRAAAKIAIKSSGIGYERPADIAAMRERGLMDEAVYKTAMSAAYAHELGDMRGDYQSASAMRAKGLAAFAPYIKDITLSDSERAKAQIALLRNVGRWLDNRTAAEVNDRFAFIRANRAPDDGQVLQDIFCSGAGTFIKSGLPDHLAQLETHLDLLDAKGKAAYAAARNEAYAAAFADISAKLAANKTEPRMLDGLLLMATRGAITHAQFAKELSRYYEEELQSYVARMFWTDASEHAELQTRIPELATLCRNAAKAVGVEWTEPGKQVRVGTCDIARFLRDSENAIEDSRFPTFVSSVIRYLSPQTDAGSIAFRLRRFLDAIEVANHKTSTFPQPTTGMAHLANIDHETNATFAQAVANVIGDALGVNFTPMYAHGEGWQVSVEDRA